MCESGPNRPSASSCLSAHHGLAGSAGRGAPRRRRWSLLPSPRRSGPRPRSLPWASPSGRDSRSSSRWWAISAMPRCRPRAMTKSGRVRASISPIVGEHRRVAEGRGPLRRDLGAGILKADQLHVGHVGEVAQVSRVVERVPVTHFDRRNPHARHGGFSISGVHAGILALQTSRSRGRERCGSGAGAPARVRP